MVINNLTNINMKKETKIILFIVSVVLMAICTYHFFG